MAENTKIEWAHHTFNPFEGCAKVSPGCKNCYAEGQHRFMYSSLGKDDGPGTCWGVNAPRLGRADDYWKKPLKWEGEAKQSGVRFRVFCASMADVFEQQSEASKAFAGQTAMVPTGKNTKRLVYFVNLDEELIRLLAMIQQTPNLDWMLLTKRPEAINPTLERLFKKLCEPERFSITDRKAFNLLEAWVLDNRPPANVWLGTSIENQAAADARIPHLLATPAAVRFLSCEPLLGPVELGKVAVHKLPVTDASQPPAYAFTDALTGKMFTQHHGGPWVNGGTAGPHIDWVIVGGESGANARPMHPFWAYSLRDQCAAAGVPFLFKQWGEWKPISDMQPGESDALYVPKRPEKVVEMGDLECREVYGERCTVATMSLHLDGRPFELGDTHPGSTMLLFRVGKHTAGRLLRQQLHDGFPQPNNL